MKHARRHDQVRMQEPAASVTIATTDPDALRLRTVHRAAAELRRGTPVLLTGDAPLIRLAAEPAGPRGLAELRALAADPPVLLRAPIRAAAVLHRPLEPGLPAVALHLNSELLAPGPLRVLADPTVEELLPAQPEPAPVPGLALPALSLAKLGRLLPAVLAAPVGPEAAAEAGRLGLFSVPAADLL